MPKEIPLFSGTEMEKVEQCIKWVKRNIQSTRWSDEKIERYLSKRTPKQIIDSGQVFYLRSCLDRTLVLIETLKRNGFQPTMVAELFELKGVKAPHFAIELNVEKQAYCAQFFNPDMATISPGKYKGFRLLKKQVKSIATHRIPGKNFSKDKTIFEAIKGTTAEKDAKYVSVKALIKKMKKENSLRRFMRFRMLSAAASIPKLGRKTRRL